jgi:hypothetical protein
MWTRLIGNNNPTLHTFSPVCRTFSATIYAHYLDDDLSLSVFVIELVCMIMNTLLSDKLLGRIPELVIMLSVNPLKETKVLQDIIRTLY